MAEPPLSAVTSAMGMYVDDLQMCINALKILADNYALGGADFLPQYAQVHELIRRFQEQIEKVS